VPNNNPLFEPTVPFPFEKFTPEQIEPAVDALIDSATKSLEKIESKDKGINFDTTLGALENASETVEYVSRIIMHLESVVSTDALREAFNRSQPKIDLFINGIPRRPILWRTIKSYAETHEAKSLIGSRARLLTKTLQDFCRAGADLDEAKQHRLAVLDEELGKLTIQFSQNFVDATDEFELFINDERRLAGLPQTIVDMIRLSAESKGKKGWRFSLDDTCYFPTMKYLDDRNIRENLFKAFLSRATKGQYNNVPLIEKILLLREQKAHLLGYANFADYILEDRMAKTSQQARKFVDNLKKNTERQFTAEVDELKAFYYQLEGQDAPPPELWDTAYYDEKRRQLDYDFNDEDLRPYFSVGRVLDGVFDIASRLYGISFEALESIPTWHESVTAYAVVSETGEQIAWIYADLYTRERKRSGAWALGLKPGKRSGVHRTPHCVVFAANLTPPVKGQPALLTHSEVEIIFHEFGHVMHHCLSEVEFRTLSGTRVARDFVELPSQIMENWCWERDALDLFARHHETAEHIPDALFSSFQRARTFRAATAQMRQLGFATIDLELHTKNVSEIKDVMNFARQVMAPFYAVRMPDYFAMIAGFSHLFEAADGYAASYYSYKWSEVLDADAFTAFKDHGLFSRETGTRFREAILAKGNTDEPMKLFVDFMGREPNPKPMLERLGLSH